MSRVGSWWDAAAVAAAKAALSFAVLATGFVALSDDDYSRTVIAEQFARSPSLDPSGTSWLPLPFWIHGVAMAIFGRSLATAHATAIVLGVLSAVCVHRAASWLGLSRPSAVFAALVAAGIPTAARLGVCAQPEALTAGLVVLGAAASTVDGSRRVLGAAALFAACLCRYEAWAAAAAFALIALYDAARGRRLEKGHQGQRARAPSVAGRPALLASAAITLVAPVIWIAHGALSHGDALFFLHRVAAYRRALGESEPLARSLVAYPAALLSAEPEATMAAIVCAILAAVRAPRALGVASRPSLVVAALLLFLVVGRVLDGAPTHHAERTLLPLWSFAALFVGEGLVRGLAAARGRPRSAARVAGVVLAVAVVSAPLRASATVQPGAPRDDERAIGLVSRLRLEKDDRLLVDTSDYGYFAIIAAFGAPERAEPVDRHDPRHPSSLEVFATDDGVLALARRSGARFLVVEPAQLSRAASLGAVVASAGRFSLVRLTSLR
ncbi:MAG TPA: hypothetical protein VHC69_22330 [Polyangiaceae bacterium]|nr:hypothetical protein [Polyangiaceae bacterium]